MAVVRVRVNVYVPWDFRVTIARTRRRAQTNAQVEVLVFLEVCVDVFLDGKVLHVMCVVLVAV